VRLAPALAALALLAGCGEDRPRLIVSAAASLAGPLTACSREFAGAAVRLSFAGSDELAAQIRQGVKPDVYVAANTRLPEELHEAGLLSRPVEFATNTFVLAVPSGSEIDSVDALAREDAAIAIGSESVPIGAYTRETLALLPPAHEQAILAKVRSNEPDVKGIVGKLTLGAADAGFVYVTDVRAAGDELEAIELPAELDPEVTYGAGVVEGAKRRDEARAFVDGLTDGPCADALDAAGFGPPPSG
jgi:molybdate transport system substrate-binding protein